MLKIQDITMIFGQGTINEKKALSHVTLTAEAGELITIIGGNGAGKSTLINCISGVCSPQSGKILIDGMDVTPLPEYKRSRYIGRVFQDPAQGTAADMTIEENLALAYGKNKPRGLHRGVAKKDTLLFKDKLAALNLGLEGRLKQKVGLLSGGQRQALTLLMATIAKPKLLLLDEHSAALDPLAAKQVLAMTARLVEEDHLCTLMVTHNMRDALTYGNRTIMMSEGQIVLNISGKEREGMTVEGLVQLFEKKVGTELNSDRMLL